MKMKKMIAMAMMAVLAMGAVTGCGSSSEAEKDTFTIAYAPNESTTESADARQGLAEDLGELLGVEVEEIQASDYNAIIEALRTGNADMAYMGSMAVFISNAMTEI